ncbi:MAG: class II fructose-bisphosphate aldolase [Firmicutes bacterium]|nr:class II fructose-bisphosphate aldolase [Bacillota bacterium]
MSLVSLQSILTAADRGGYAVGAFNAFNVETTQAVVAAAEAEKSPVILLVYDGHQRHFGIAESAAIGRALAEAASVPVALHLDHGASFEMVVKCLQAGYTGVMFDGSRLPYEDNVAITKRVTEVAHLCGVSVEAELGQVGVAARGDGAKADLMTAPDQAADFVAQTQVDALAVAIGNAHGFYTDTPKLDFERLAAINEAVSVPLVLHGGTGIPDDDLRRAIELGIRKVNIGTEVMTAFGTTLREALKNTEGPIVGLAELAQAKRAMQEKIQARMRVLGSSGKA